MYCRKCRYDLKGSPGHRCPECGHEFEPTNPWSTLSSKREALENRVGMIAIVIGALLGLICLFYLPMLLYWRVAFGEGFLKTFLG